MSDIWNKIETLSERNPACERAISRYKESPENAEQILGEAVVESAQVIKDLILELAGKNLSGQPGQYEKELLKMLTENQEEERRQH